MWAANIYDEANNKIGGGVWEFISAKFHEWGYEAYDNVSFSVGIIELEDGKVKMVTPDQIMFSTE